MTKAANLLCSGMLLLFACNRPAEQQARQPQSRNAPSLHPPEKNAGAPADDRTLLDEPNGSIDPDSVEAAGQIVQRYGALIEQQRWAQAGGLWGNSGQAAKFRADLAPLVDLHLEIGNLGEPEGAAGSIFVTMPVIFYGDLENGQPFRRSAQVILRRVNQVPGSTQAQRRWHIERIDWAG